MRKIFYILFIFLFFFTVAGAFSTYNDTSMPQKFGELNQISKGLQLSVKLYPNPANDILTVEFGSELPKGKLDIEVMTIIGNKASISFEKDGDMRYKVHLKGLKSGYYLLIITTEEGKREAFKFLKQ
ncbi:MAG: T9SS type A sorting domain-containing protein [Cyclobacteriaceae bacterium]|nr:T9SS type A sorting domain-containing protein [Cyclobacteriaceae bacterium]MCH8517566.1 T9SS type A sorting domain-containing protein [Cyclobacteriaceae bacterium]